MRVEQPAVTQQTDWQELVGLRWRGLLANTSIVLLSSGARQGSCVT
jgi:hypothetical protein